MENRSKETIFPLKKSIHRHKTPIRWHKKKYYEKYRLYGNSLKKKSKFTAKKV